MEQPRLELGTPAACSSDRYNTRYTLDWRDIDPKLHTRYRTYDNSKSSQKGKGGKNQKGKDKGKGSKEGSEPPPKPRKKETHLKDEARMKRCPFRVVPRPGVESNISAPGICASWKDQQDRNDEARTKDGVEWPEDDIEKVEDATVPTESDDEEVMLGDMEKMQHSKGNSYFVTLREWAISDKYTFAMKYMSIYHYSEVYGDLDEAVRNEWPQENFLGQDYEICRENPEAHKPRSP